MRAALAALLFATALAAPARADPTSTDPSKMSAGAYELDPRHASLVVKVAHMGGFSRYTMRFNRLKGAFIYDPASWRSTPVTITIDPTSIDTGDGSFNRTIATYLGAAKRPTITFVSRSITPTGQSTGKLEGDLTLNGVTEPVVLDVTFNGFGPSLLGMGTRLGFSGTGRIKRSHYRVNAVSDVAGDDVDLIFDVEFVKKSSP